MPLGLYISVPFCNTKCSYCNFASGVFPRALHARYVDRVCEDMQRSEQIAADMGGGFDRQVDSIYLGGGTPTVLQSAELRRIFAVVRDKFTVAADAEITVECAPGSLPPEVMDALAGCAVNRVSLGVQSFLDHEARSVGRLHTRAIVLDDIARLRAAGVANISVDLIAGLPHQTSDSWRHSVQQAIDAGVPHVSVYMMEVDEDSRLGRELLAGGTRYHAHFVPDEDLTADFYQSACEQLDAAGIAQYEISNFARQGCEARHNLKYWTRQPYFGFGVDAHSMLLPGGLKTRVEAGVERTDVAAVRFATSDSLDAYLSGARLTRTAVSCSAALDEAYFLGLRLTRGIRTSELTDRYGAEAATAFREQIAELQEIGLLEVGDDRIQLTDRGRLLSNEVFANFCRHDSVTAGAAKL